MKTPEQAPGTSAVPGVDGHRIDLLLREDEHEWVVRTSLIAQGFTSSGAAIHPALTRISKVVLLAGYERKLKAAVFDGAPLDERLPWELRRILDGYRVRASLPLEWSLARVLSVALSDGGHPYVSRTWVEGIPLGTALAAVPAIDHVLSQILVLLDALHDRCIVVQDLKPDNLVLDVNSRVWLIDIESLRAAPLGAIPCTHFTPRFAAPEQIRGRTSGLASDMYAFGRLILDVAGPHARRWLELAERCINEDPLARPTAPIALAWMRAIPSAKGALPSWRQHDTTIRVPEPTDPIGISSLISQPPAASPLPRHDTLPVGEPLDTRPKGVPAPPEKLTTLTPRDAPAEEIVENTLPVARRRPIIRVISVFSFLFLLAIVLSTVYAAVMLERAIRAQIALSEDSDRLVELARAGLRDHKVIPEKNNDQELVRSWILARQAVILDPDADALGVLALATVWSQRWQRVGTIWDAHAFEETGALVEQANAAGRTPEGLLARGLLSAAACRLGPAPEAARRCDESIDHLDRVARYGEDWMVVEARWGAVTVANTTSRRALQRGEMVDAATYATQSLRQCRLAEPILSSAPVNGVELVEDCTWAAGVARDRDAWMRWADRWLKARSERPGRVSAALYERLARSAAPECARLTFERAPSTSSAADAISQDDGRTIRVLRAPLPSHTTVDGSWSSWCATMAERVIACQSSSSNDCLEIKTTTGGLFDLSWR